MKQQWLLPAIIPVIILESAACNVPVFRYALERWQPERYVVSYVHDGTVPIDEQLSSRMAALCADEMHSTGTTATDRPDGARVNASFRIIDTGKPLSPEERTIIGNNAPESPALLRVSFPFAAGIRTPLWSGDPSGRELAQLFTSPLRERIVSLIISGTTAVWVLIESGDRRQDEAAWAILEKELERSTKEIVLPELTAQDSMDYLPSGSPELRIDFEMIRMNRNDSLERYLIAMVEALEPPLVKMRDKPVAFTVFGRGRYLHALVGKGINAETIGQTNRYITGPCACTVKGENPGKDLLLPDRWESGIRRKYVREVQPPKELFGLGQFLKRKETGGVTRQAGAVSPP